MINLFAYHIHNLWIYTIGIVCRFKTNDNFLYSNSALHYTTTESCESIENMCQFFYMFVYTHEQWLC